MFTECFKITLVFYRHFLIGKYRTCGEVPCDHSHDTMLHGTEMLELKTQSSDHKEHLQLYA